MVEFSEIFIDGSGPFGLSPDFILNVATEAGGAVLTAAFTAGLVQVANEWRRDVQRDARRAELIARMRGDLDMIVELGGQLAKYAPLEIERFKSGEQMILPPIKGAPGAINSVQLMVFVAQAAGSFADRVRGIAPITRLKRRNISGILFPGYERQRFELIVDHIASGIKYHVNSFIADLTEIERERVISMRDRARQAGRYLGEDGEENEEIVPDFFKQDVSDLRLYARELVIAVWRYNKIYDLLKELSDLLEARSARDNFTSQYIFAEITVDGKTPRQGFEVQVNGTDFFEIYRR